MQMPNEQTNTLSGSYLSWFGKPVVLRVAAREFHTVVTCTIVGESDAVLRVRVGGIWVVEIFKEMILSIEESQPGFAPFLAGESADEPN
jgi:hypothetical protein